MKIITANSLDTGSVMYLDTQGAWTTQLAHALRIDDSDVDDILSSAKARVLEIADAYAVNIDARGALHGRETLRETLRKAGPSVRKDLGYQGQVAL